MIVIERERVKLDIKEKNPVLEMEQLLSYLTFISANCAVFGHHRPSLLAVGKTLQCLFNGHTVTHTHKKIQCKLKA